MLHLMVGPALLSAMTGTAYAYRCFNAPVVKDGGPSGKNDRPWDGPKWLIEYDLGVGTHYLQTQHHF